MIFANPQFEILHLKKDAEIGCTKAQHQLGLFILQLDDEIQNYYEAYKWLFISCALGNEGARNDLIKVNSLLGSDDDIDEGFDRVLEWFGNKFDHNEYGEEEKWSPELLKWRFSAAHVH